MEDPTPHQQTWPLRIICLFYFPFVLFSIWRAPMAANTWSSFTDPLSCGVFLFFWIRVAIAKIRKEEGRGWIFYLILVYAVPILSEIYARKFIPLVYAPSAP